MRKTDFCLKIYVCDITMDNKKVYTRITTDQPIEFLRKKLRHVNLILSYIRRVKSDYKLESEDQKICDVVSDLIVSGNTITSVDYQSICTLIIKLFKLSKNIGVNYNIQL